MSPYINTANATGVCLVTISNSRKSMNDSLNLVDLDARLRHTADILPSSSKHLWIADHVSMQFIKLPDRANINHARGIKLSKIYISTLLLCLATQVRWRHESPEKLCWSVRLIVWSQLRLWAQRRYPRGYAVVRISTNQDLNDQYEIYMALQTVYRRYCVALSAWDLEHRRWDWEESGHIPSWLLGSQYL